MNPKGATTVSEDVACMAAWIAWGLQRGFLTPLEVHGGAKPRPSKRSLTVSPELIAALNAGPAMQGSPK